MKKIDELLQWYEQNSLTPHDCMTSIELEKINRLYEGFKDYTNQMFVEAMIESFCKIIEMQQKKAIELEECLKTEIMVNSCTGSDDFENQQLGHGFAKASNFKHQSFIPRHPVESIEEYYDEKQLQNAFTQYCLNNGSSSYTVNDYCSRIKKIWKAYASDYKNDKLTGNLGSDFPETPFDSALINAYYNIEELIEYVEYKISETERNSNWLNARSALNKFYEFKKH